MAVRVVAGKPGAGKSYWCVAHILKKYFDYDKTLLEYFPRTNVIIITNIDELKLDHFRLDEKIQEGGGIEKFFTVEYQRAIVKKWGRIIYLIDEAHKYFDETVKSKDVHFFFQYHRHIGIDMYLVTTGISLLPTWVQRVVEVRIQANPRSKGVANTFIFQQYVEGESAGRIVLLKKQEIFRLYKSMDMSETEKPKSLLTKYVVGIAFAVIGFGAILVWLLTGFTNRLIGGDKVTAALAPGGQKVSSTLRAKTESDRAKGLKRGVPLAEQGVKGGAVSSASTGLGGFVQTGLKPAEGSEKVEGEIKFDRVYVTRSIDGSPVIYSNSGLMSTLDVKKALSEGVIVSGQVFVKRPKAGAADERMRPPQGVTDVVRRDGAVITTVRSEVSQERGSGRGFEPGAAQVVPKSVEIVDVIKVSNPLEKKESKVEKPKGIGSGMFRGKDSEWK